MGYVKLVFLMLFSFLCQLAFCSSLSHLCLKDQALALLQFKHMFTIDAYSKLLSWNKSVDCCSWNGVHCNEATGQVIELNLTRCGLRDLVGLRTLNLSHNRLEGHIPASLHQLSVLESLDLSSNKIIGEIPQQLASLKSLEVLNLSHNHLVGCIPKGKQFDTFENSSYQGNDGLRGLPLSKDCGGDEGVPQATTPFGLDQEEEEGDSTIISWQAVLMGYGCGLVIGLSIIYIMQSTQYPAWFSRMDVELEHIIVTRMKRHKKRH